MPNQTPPPLTPEIVSAILRDPDRPHYPTQITVFCDHCGTEHTGDYMVHEGMSSEERLAVARQHLVDNEGWEHTDDGDDFCPEHAGSPSKPQALVELEAQGCTTWQLTPRDFSRIADEVDRLRPWVFSKSYWEWDDTGKKTVVVGLRVGAGENRVVARFGDWLVRHPDNTFTVHPAPAAVETGE
jgi:hypothetical protein